MIERIYEKDGELLKPKEELVRCKDCKHWRQKRIGLCEREGLYGIPMFFCAYGEREEGPGNEGSKEIRVHVDIENMEEAEVLLNEIREKTEEVNSLIKKLGELTLKPVICR